MRTLTIDYPRLLRSGLLLFFSFILIRLTVSGEINLLVSPVIAIIVKVSILLLVIVTIASLRWSLSISFRGRSKQLSSGCQHHHTEHCDCGHEHAPANSGWSRFTHLLFAASIAVGFSWHPKALGTEMIAQASPSQPGAPAAPAAGQPNLDENQQSYTAGSSNLSQTTLLSNSSQDNLDAVVTDQPAGTDSQASIAMRFEEDPSKYWGKKVLMDGFVYHPPGLPSNYFVLTRYFVFCCIADASPIGITVKSSAASTLKSDTWVSVSGVIQPVQMPVLNQIQPTAWYSGHGPAKMPSIEASSLQKIPTPKQPYMFPQ